MKKEIWLVLLGMFVMLIIILGFNLHLRVRQLEMNVGQIVNVLTQKQQQRPQPVMVPDEKKK